MGGLDLQFMIDILPDMLRAAWVTVKISVLTIIFSVSLGVVLASWKILGGRLAGALIQSFVEFTRGSAAAGANFHHLFRASAHRHHARRVLDRRDRTDLRRRGVCHSRSSGVPSAVSKKASAKTPLRWA